MIQNLKMIKCSKCNLDMPELRKTLYNYTFCASCSDSKNLIKPKLGVSVMRGEGDHTYIETVIMDEDQYKIYSNSISNANISSKFNKVKELTDDEEGTSNLIGPVTIINDIN